MESALDLPIFDEETLERQILIKAEFLAQDLRKLYFLMDVGYDDLAGSEAGIRSKAIALIEYAQKRRRLPELWQKMNQHSNIKLKS